MGLKREWLTSLGAAAAIWFVLVGRGGGCEATGDQPDLPGSIEGEGDGVRIEDDREGERRPGESLEECREREFDWNCE